MSGETYENQSIKQELKAKEKRLSIAEKAQSFAKAMSSAAFQEKATQEEQERRLKICSECDSFEKKLNIPNIDGHCKACGCLKNKFTLMSIKSKILTPDICPKKLWKL